METRDYSIFRSCKRGDELKVLIACEYSGIVRREFEKRGHDVTSADFEPSFDESENHYQGDMFDLDLESFDLMIAHPPCTYLTVAGSRWFYDPDDKSRPHPNYPNRWEDRRNAIEFFNRVKSAPINRKCIENSLPMKYVTDRIGMYSQRVQPWMFGSQYTKGACLWLDGLEPLIATHEKPDVVIAKCHKESPGPDRWKRRSVTDKFIAEAMANAWG